MIDGNQKVSNKFARVLLRPACYSFSTFCITCSRCSLSHSETYYVQPKNLAPIVGTEKVASFHKDSKLESYNYKDMVP